MKVSYIDNDEYFLRYLTNTILTFDIAMIEAAVERLSKLSNKRYASYIQKFVHTGYRIGNAIIGLMLTVLLICPTGRAANPAYTALWPAARLG